MSDLISKVEIIKEAGEIFKSFTTKDVTLENYQTVDFIISSGTGELSEILVQIEGRNSTEETPETIPFYKKTGNEFVTVSEDGDKLTIGGTVGNTGSGIYRVYAADLAQKNYDRVYLKVSPSASTQVPGCVLALCYGPRYSE